MGLYAGVVAFNIILLTVGYSALWPALRGHTLRSLISYAGLALLLGTGLVGVVLSMLMPLGLRLGLGLFAAVSVVIAVGGIVLGRWRGEQVILPRAEASVRPGGLTDIVTTVAAFGLVAVLVLALVGGFRSSPWLDDTWYFWLPKGRALDLLGLDPRLWHPDLRLHMTFGHDYESLWFIRPDNPLWWSVILDLDLRFVGSIDLRAVNAELALLLTAFAASIARLLWGWVRPWILLPGVLLIVSAPELLRQTQGGDADVPLAIYLSLAILAAFGWLYLRSRYALALFVVFSSTAIALKSEGVLELALYLAILSAAAWRAGRAVLLLWAAALGAFATSVPWLAWRVVHDVPNVFSLRNALSPSYLSAHLELLHGALRILRHNFTSIREWSLLVVLTVVLSVAVAVRERRAEWLAPSGVLVAAYLLFVWISWADPQGAFRLIASAYRYVTPPILVAGVFVPILAERLISRSATTANVR